MRQAGVYIVGESSCLIPGSGAFQHIEIGIHELSKHFEIVKVCTCRTSNTYPKDSGATTKTGGKRRTRFAWLKKQVRFLFVLAKNHVRFFSYYKAIKKARPSFIYERASYLNFNGLVASKLLRIPHFYEVNGILWLDRKDTLPGFWNRVAFHFENRSYKASNFVFFVGGLARYFGVPAERYLAVQNGIEREFINRFRSHHKSPGTLINVVFVGHAMPHHRLDILYKATFRLRSPERFCFHFVGNNMEDAAKEMNPKVKVIYHGVLGHDLLGELLLNCEVGIIPFVRDYYSNVKAFMYGAAKLLIVLPLEGNFQSVFGEMDVLSFQNDNVDHLALKLDELPENTQMICEKGEAVYWKINENYTWDAIFSKKIGYLKQHLQKDGSTSPARNH